MDLGLEGKRAAVMAASQGLGRAAAEALAGDGARVAICARNTERLETTAQEIAKATGTDVFPIQADVSTASGVQTFVDGAADALGGLDILVTNKGGPRHGTFEDVDDPEWEAAFDLVVMSYVRAVRTALVHLREAGGGAVVAIESMSVRQPIGNLVLSNALRPSVVALSKSLALQHGAEGIRFNVVLPGSMETDRIVELTQDDADRQGVSLDEAMAERVRSVPMGRLGQPIELGRLVAFLASPAAGYITGETLAADGGAIQGVH